MKKRKKMLKAKKNLVKMCKVLGVKPNAILYNDYCDCHGRIYAFTFAMNKNIKNTEYYIVGYSNSYRNVNAEYRLDTTVYPYRWIEFGYKNF